MYETYCYELQPYFRQEKIQLRYMDTESSVLSEITKAKINDLKVFEGVFDFSNLNEKHEILSIKNK